MCWIAEHVKEIKHLKCYINDNCSFTCLGDVKYYPPYKHYFLTDQIKLLQLWDEIGLPHDERKQIYRLVIPFIGFDIDLNVTTFSINDEHKSDLLQKIRDFNKSKKHCSLKDFQSLASHVNWSLAFFPLLKPGLSAVYEKMVGKTQAMTSICANNAVQDELLWFIKHP